MKIVLKENQIKITQDEVENTFQVTPNDVKFLNGVLLFLFGTGEVQINIPDKEYEYLGETKDLKNATYPIIFNFLISSIDDIISFYNEAFN